MGTRTVTEWTDTGANNEYKKVLPDLEARIRLVKEGSTDLSLGSGVGALNAGEYYFDYSADTLYVRATDSGNVNSKTITVYTYFQVFGTWGTQTEMNTNLELFQKITPDESIYVRYILITIMKYGNPTFTDLKLDIHAELSDYPTDKVLATPENTWTNATINSYENAQSEIWFRYDKFAMKANESYCLVLKGTGTFSDSSHVAWVKFEPVYRDGLTIDRNLLAEGPYRYTVIGRKA